MLDISAGGQTPLHSPTPPIEFVTCQLMPLADGTISFALKASRFDETDLNFIDDEIVSERITTIDEALALLKAHVRIAPKLM